MGDSEVARDRMHFGPGKMEMDVQEMVDEAAKSSGAIGRYLGLQNLGRKMWEWDASVGDVDWRTRLLAEAKAVERELDEPEEFCRDGPGFAAAVCIRDHLDELDEESSSGVSGGWTSRFAASPTRPTALTVSEGRSARIECAQVWCRCWRSTRCRQSGSMQPPFFPWH